MDVNNVNIILIGILTLIAALGFGWLVVAPYYKWAIRQRFKNKRR